MLWSRLICPSCVGLTGGGELIARHGCGRGGRREDGKGRRVREKVVEEEGARGVGKGGE